MRMITSNRTGFGRRLPRTLAWLLSVALVFTMMPLAAGGTEPAHSASKLTLQEPALVVTGQGLIGGNAYNEKNVGLERSWSLEELKKLECVRGELYSARKQQPPFTRSYFLADGVKVSSLLGDADAYADEITFQATDGYRCSFLKGAEYVNPSETKAAGLAGGRYLYDGFGTAKTKEVPAILSWAYDSTEGANGEPPTDKPEAVKDVSGGKLRLIVGQYDGKGGGSEDMNQPLFNGGSKASVNRIQVGAPVTGTVLKVGDREYTRQELLLMPFAERTYYYTNKKGNQTSVARGVPMTVLLEGAKPEDLVSFTAADGYPVNNDEPMTVKELTEGNFMLAYEMDGKAVYNESDSVSGVLSLCGDGFNPAKMVSSISVATEGTDFSKSEYKHITNGGITGQTGPYNIDAITGATLTIEGPGTEASVPLSVRDMEGRNAGCYRGVYGDVRGAREVKRTYEGIDLYYLLHEMSSGDNGIRLTSQAHSVKIKNRNRQTIAELTLDQIRQMHDDGDPAIVAYGTAYEDGSGARPFVFDGGTGANADLGNADGCLKFVYDRDRYGGNPDYTAYGNMAYIYVERAETPGFKHDKAPYNTARNSQYVLTVTGDEIGREVNYKVEDIEKLVEYDAGGNVTDNGYGWRSEYSLANSSYWYVNTYEGVRLWSLLQHSGLDPAKAGDTETRVTFRSTDNYGGFDVFSLKQVADPDCFGFYEKNAADNNDGTYVPNENIRKGDDVTTGDKLRVGYPVLVAYGVNEYPYVIDRSLPGFLSGLSNDGGPLRVISGKMDYNHANGSNQAKLLDKIVVGGETYHYSTHTYQPQGSDYAALADSALAVTVKNGTTKTKRKFTVKDIEELLYGGTLSAAQLKEAKIKGFYETGKKGSYSSDLYEGLDLRYFIRDVLQLQGSQGKITFKAGSKKLTLDLKTVLSTKNGYNASTKLDGLAPVIAFAKNGYPMVPSAGSAGYLASDSLTKVSGSAAEATSFPVKNSGGPLQIVFPRSSKKATSVMGNLANVTSIEIDLKPDKYAHVTKPYDKLAKKTLTIGGAGTWLTKDKRFTVNELEGKQSIIVTKDYSVKKGKKKASQVRYRGLPLYEFLKSTDVGLKTSADKVLVYTKARPGKPYSFALSEIMKTSYRNTVTGKKKLPVMLAFGSSSVKIKDAKKGRPLVASTKAKGYSKKYKNSGGPLKLVVGQTGKKDRNAKKILSGVTRIEVTSGERVSWNHSSSEVFKGYLDDTLQMTVTGRDGSSRTKTLTVEQLEGMTDIISQEEIYATSENTWEGLNFWKLLQQEFADVPGIDDPVKIQVGARDGFSVDALEKAGLDGLKNGIKDGENRVPVLLAYGVDGYPLAAGGKNTPTGEGYDSTVNNRGGPLRLMVHNAQGACIMEVTSITITVEGAVEAGSADAGARKAPGGIAAVPGGDGVAEAGGALAVRGSANDAGAVAGLLSRLLQPLGEEVYAGERESVNASGSEARTNSFAVYEGTGNPGDLPLAGLRSTAMDRDGNLWIGTYGGGAACLMKGADQFIRYNTKSEPALESTVVSAICPDAEGGVWMSQNASYTDPGANRGVVYLKDGQLTTYRAPDTVANDYVQQIKVDQDGKVWFGSFGGVTIFDPQKKTWKTFAKEECGFPATSVNTIALDGAGGAWLGFYPDGAGTEADPYTGGFCHMDGAGKVDHVTTAVGEMTTDKSTSKLAQAWVRNITIDREGGVWVVASGTNLPENEGGTLWYLAPGAAEPVKYTGDALFGSHLDGSGTTELRVVLADAKGGLWFGTSADGLLYVKDPAVKKGKMQVTAQFESADGFWPSENAAHDMLNFDNVYSLEISGETLYVGTASGLLACDLSKGLPSANILASTVPSLTSAKAGKKKAVLRWKAIEGADGYVIYRASKKGGKYKAVKTVKDVKADATVTVRAAAAGADATGTVKPVATIGDASGGLKAAVTSAETSGGFESATADADASGGLKAAVIGADASGAVKATITKLKKGKSYFKVRAYRSVNGQKVWSKYSKVRSVKVR